MKSNDDHKSFYERAAQLGHDKAVLESQGKQITTRTVYSVREMRELVGPVDPSHRAKRQTELVAARAGRSESLTDRVESFLYGTGELTDREHEESQAGFPVSVALASFLAPVTLPPGETVIGPSGSPTVQNYDTLNIPSDSFITVKNTYYTLNVTNLVMQAPRG